MFRNANINRMLVLGGHIQAVGLVRQAEGLPVSVCVKDGWAVARFSKYVSETIVADSDEKLVSVLKSRADKNTLLVPTSDDYIDMISSDYEWFAANYTLLLPEREVIDIFKNKRSAYSFCEQLGIKQPTSFCPKSIDDLKCNVSNLQYPVVLKPAVMYDFHSKFGKKAFLCRDAEELLSRANAINDAGYDVSRLLVQEFLSGGPRNLYSVGVFAVDGEIKASITANRIRQNPMDFGNSTTFAITCQQSDIEHAAAQIIKATQYSGLGEVEFMYDVKDRCYKFLEINTRSWKWHTLSRALGFGFLSEVIRWHKGLESNFNAANMNKVAAWAERLTDFAVVIKNRLDLNEVYKSYKMPKCNALLSLSDPLPALMYVLMSPILYVKRY